MAPRFILLYFFSYKFVIDSFLIIKIKVKDKKQISLGLLYSVNQSEETGLNNCRKKKFNKEYKIILKYI